MGMINLSTVGLHDLMDREWLAVNRIGGYAAQTILGLNTRKYHGLLVAAMSPPVRRMVILSRVEDFVRVAGRVDPISCAEYPGVIHPNGRSFLKAFNPNPYPRWGYQGDGWTIEKSVRLISGENTVVLSYTLLAGDRSVELEVKPLLALRGIHEMMYQSSGRLSAQVRSPRGLHIGATARTPETFIAHDGEFESHPNWYLATIYRREAERGYSALEDVWTPGAFRWKLEPGKTVHLVCSTESIDLDQTLARADAIADDVRVCGDREISNGPRSSEPIRLNDPTLQTLLCAADEFVAQTSDRNCAIMGGFPWQSASGRDALIGFTGLLLVPRRFSEARSLLISTVNGLHHGIAPSEFPEDGGSPAYTSADASLWLANAVAAYLRYTNDETTVSEQLLEPLVRLLRRYRMGTSLGIQCDADGLLQTRQPGLGTTWMNAKIGDWVITQRAGRPVELNALWYNALRIARELSERLGRRDWSEEFARMSAMVSTAFNARFWDAERNCCYDVVLDNGVDTSIRPNQLLAISLPNAVLWPERWMACIETLEKKLLTPVGLRTLAPDETGYVGKYQGDVVSRDRAYHQGSVYPWLLGPYVTALAKAHGRTDLARTEAREALTGCIAYMNGNGLGQICELFDGDAPHRPGGAIASARSVGEVLRCYVEDVIDPAPPRLPNQEKTTQLSP
jgi:predicted glycogen debranching enzyme